MEAGLHNWLRLLALGMIWGSSFMAVSVAVGGIGPLSVAAGRITLAALALLALTRLGGISLPPFRAPQGRIVWLAALAFGFFSMVLPFFLLSWGQKYVSSGFAGVTMAAVPLLVLPLAHFLVPGERMSLRKLFGFCIGFAGVVVLIGPGAFARAGTDLEPLARLACLAAGASYALGSIITRLAPKVDPVAFATAATLLASLMILPVAVAVEGIPRGSEAPSLLAVLYLGLVPTALANLLLVAVIRSAGPSFMSLVNYQVPVWSVIFGTLFLRETLPPQLLPAMGMILAGLAISNFARARRRSATR